MASTSTSDLGVRRRRPTVVQSPIDRSWYGERLDITEYDQIIDWEALRAGKFSKAVGRRGGRPSELISRLKELRLQELLELYGIPPPAPPLVTAAAAVAAAPTSAPEGSSPLIEEVDLTSAPAPPTSNPITAATSYIRTIGAAASKFMLDMSTATETFVSQVQASGSGRGSSGGQCAICFEEPKEPYFGRCSHVFCRGCLMHPALGSRMQLEGNASPIQSMLVRSCPQCRRQNISFYKMLE